MAMTAKAALMPQFCLEKAGSSLNSGATIEDLDSTSGHNHSQVRKNHRTKDDPARVKLSGLGLNMAQ